MKMQKTQKAWAVIQPEKDIEIDLCFFSTGDITELPFAVFSPYDKEEAESWAALCSLDAKVVPCTITYDLPANPPTSGGEG